MRRGRGQWFRSRRRGKPTPGSRLALFTNYSYHAFITDREGDTLDLEADHRRHAEIENAIRDLKYGVGLNHLPSGRFPANAAWLAVQVMVTVQTCGDLRAIRPLTEGQPSTEFALQADSSPQT